MPAASARLDGAWYEKGRTPFSSPTVNTRRSAIAASIGATTMTTATVD